MAGANWPLSLRHADQFRRSLFTWFMYIRRPRQTQGGARQGIIHLSLVSDYYRSSAAAPVLHCYGVSLSGIHACAAASRQRALYIVWDFPGFIVWDSLRFSWISENTLGSFLLPFCVIFGTKLGGVLLFRVSFEKEAAAAQEQQEQQFRSFSVLHCHGDLPLGVVRF